MRFRRRALPALAAASALWLAGCAAPPRAATAPPAAAFWSGRLALQVASEPPQSLSGGFELRGSAASGELALYNPLGSTVAVLAWAPGSATLRGANGEQRAFASLEALVTHATGTALPVGALFDWLAGTPTEVPGWSVDLSQRERGRLLARRQSPAPTAELRLALER